MAQPPLDKPGYVKPRVGQIWRHHSTGSYCVVRLLNDGRAVIENSWTATRTRVWPDYLNQNFEHIGYA